MRIQRKKETEHFISEDADFSTVKIKKLINQGEQDDDENALAQKRKKLRRVLIHVHHQAILVQPATNVFLPKSHCVYQSIARRVSYLLHRPRS